MLLRRPIASLRLSPARLMSHWSSVPLGAPDPILGLVEAFKLDPSPDKVRPPLTRRSLPFGARRWPDARLSGQGLVSVAPSPAVVRRGRRALP